MFEYQEKGRYFAQAQRGLEELAKEELEELGAVNCEPGFCGVHFKASMETMYGVNYRSRIVSRVLAPLVSFKCMSEDELYQNAYEVEWWKLFSHRQTFAVYASVSDSRIKHSKFAALRLKDAIADAFRKKFNARPTVDTEVPDVWINLNLRKDQAVINLDTSGGSLHRRGYRKNPVPAPLQETLAAALVRLSGWPGESDEPRPFVDFMCGSGTILAEAMMVYCRIPPAFNREVFGFFHLPGFDHDAWMDVKNAADREIRECPWHLLKGFDIDSKAVAAAVRNLNLLPGGFRVTVRRSDFRKLDKLENHMIVCNPPYGVRLSDKRWVMGMFKDLGDFLKQRCKGSTAYILAGSKDLSKHLGLKITQRIPLHNGPLDVRLLKVDVY